MQKFFCILWMQDKLNSQQASRTENTVRNTITKIFFI